MKRILLLLLLPLFLITIPGIAGQISPYDASTKTDANKPQAAPESHPAEILVRFKKSTGESRINAITKRHGAKEIKRFKQPKNIRNSTITQWRTIKLSNNANKKKVMEALQKNPFVEIVEPNYKVNINALPNDPMFSSLWGLHNTGQTGGTNDSDIDAPEAWDNLTGANSNIIVAVIDTGVDYNHPDLAANMWTNPDEIPANGIDDDSNGYIDDVYGYDFYNYDADPWDDRNHGTHVAGTISAVGNNNIGVTGVSWGARIMAVKFLSASGSGYTSDAVNAVLYATGMGAKIMNNSWGGGGYSQALADAISAANDAGSLFVAAAGNSSRNNDRVPHYPSSYDISNVLAVAATDHEDLLAYFSSYGASTVDLSAPGVNILSTVPGSSYASFNGTSMATPHVAGAAALLLAQNPDRSALGLKRLIMDTTDSIPALTDITVSGGRLNVASAVNCDTTGYTASIISPRDNFTVTGGDPTIVRALLSSCGNPIKDATVSASFDNNDTTITLYDDGLHDDLLANDGIYAGTWNPYTFGTVVATVTSTHPVLGNRSDSVTGSVLQNATYDVSDEPYSWVDATPGTAITLTDDGTINIPMGFNFQFYDIGYDNITVSANGIVIPGTNSTGAYVWANDSIPDSDAPNNLIAPYWDDLDPSAGGMIYSLLDGTAPNRRFIISWVDIPHRNTTGTASFQVILEESSNNIIFQYQDTDFGNTLYNNGISATVGVEDVTGTIGTQISYNNSSITPLSAKRLVYHGIVGNHRPAAIISAPEFAELGAYITLDGTGSYDLDNDALTHLWDLGDGNSSELPVVDHAYASIGTYNVELVVNDGIVPSTPANKELTVVGPAAPVADIGGPYETFAGGIISFDASASYDPDGDTVRYLWTFDDGSTATGPVANHQYYYSGTYSVNLLVSDGIHEALPVTTTVTVLPNQIPDAVIDGPGNVHWGTPVVYDASASYDPDGHAIVAYEWTVNSQVVSTESSLTYTFPEPGNYTVWLKVYDGYLWSSTSGLGIVVENQAPTAAITAPTSAHWGVPVQFDGALSADPDGDPITRYYWKFGDGRTTTGVNPTHSFAAPGSYTVTLTVSDGFATSLAASHVITIDNLAPTATITAPTTAHWGVPVQFDGALSTDADGDSITQYNWNFGDGATATGVNPTHSFTSPGSYTVTLTVSDGVTTSLAASHVITIGNLAPTATITAPTTAHWDDPVRFDGALSADPDGDAITQYNWNFGDGATATGANATHSFASPGNYTVTLTVSDGFATSLAASHVITIENDIPIAQINDPDTARRLQSKFIAAWGADDPSGDPITLHWDFGDGTTETTTTRYAYHTYSEIGTYTITLVVADAFDESAPATAQVEVLNSVPFINIVRSGSTYEGDILLSRCVLVV